MPYICAQEAQLTVALFKPYNYTTNSYIQASGMMPFYHAKSMKIATQALPCTSRYSQGGRTYKAIFPNIQIAAYAGVLSLKTLLRILGGSKPVA